MNPNNKIKKRKHVIMRILAICLLALFIATIGESQVCASLDNWSFVSDNGDGTCTYDLSIIVDSGNGASGTATFFNDGLLVHTETNCTCNPTTVSFQVTVVCETTISIEVEYDAPGNGNDCSGTTGDIVLPIEWGNISIRNEGIKNNLSWSTLMEVNNEKFVIEYSKTSIDFNEIGFIKGAGESTSKMEYSFSHIPPSSGINYYRIKQVDYDGHYAYSKILSTTNKLKKEIRTYPNPFNEIIYITTEDDTEQWEIKDIYGNTILKGSSKEISTSNLIEGTYIIKLFNGSSFQQEVIMKM